MLSKLHHAQYVRVTPPVTQYTCFRLTPSLPQSVTFSDSKMQGRACQQYIVRSYNIYFQSYEFRWKPFHMPVRKRKRRQKQLKVSNLALLLAVFKWQPHGSEGVKIKHLLCVTPSVRHCARCLRSCPLFAIFLLIRNVHVVQDHAHAVRYPFCQTMYMLSKTVLMLGQYNYVRHTNSVYRYSTSPKGAVYVCRPTHSVYRCNTFPSGKACARNPTHVYMGGAVWVRHLTHVYFVYMYNTSAGAAVYVSHPTHV